MSSNNSKTIDIKDRIVSNQTHGVEDISCGGSLENPTHKLSKKIEKSIFPGLSLSNPTEEDRNFIFRDENDNVMVVDKTPGESRYVWRKITSLDEYVSGEEYLIIWEIGNMIFDGSEVADENANFQQYKDYMKKDDEIEYNEFTSNLFFTITDVDGGVSILSHNGKYIGRTANSNGMNISSDIAFVNTISFDDNGNVIIISTAGPSLQMNSSIPRFRYFKSTQLPIQLYRKVEVSVPDEYKWKTLVSNDDIDVITEEELDEILVPQCIEGNKMDC